MIYIITNHISYSFNCGACLQAFALKKAIESISDSDVEVINYRSNYLKKRHRYLYANSFKAFIRAFIYLMDKAVAKYKFYRFVNKFILKPNQKEYDNLNIKKFDYISEDIFLVGSDQVWNYNLTNKDDNFFLSFVSGGNKYSYASSFGNMEVFNDNKEEYLHLLKEFKEISLREPIGVDEIADEIRPPHVHLDPTLLIDSKEWYNFVKETNKKYILIYILNSDEHLLEYAKKLSKLTGLKIIMLNGHKRKDLLIKKKHSFAPHEFLSFIYNAEYVVTNSFHGTVFSILFQKRFITKLQGDCNYNYRAANLLQILNLQKRALDLFDVNYNDEINWELVEARLNAEREKSFEYLRHITKIEKG